jgi:uncharacterized protein (TIGR03435 family)
LLVAGCWFALMIKRNSIAICLGLTMAGGFAASAGAQSGTARHPTQRMMSAGAEGGLAERVHIGPTTMLANSASLERGSDTWSARGYELKALIAQIYDVDVRQVDVPDGTDANGRYDLTVTLPKEVTQDEMQRLLLDAVERKFNLDIKPEVRSMYVYVMTAPNGPAGGLHPQAATRGRSAEDAGAIQYAGRGCFGVEAEGVSVTGKTIAEFGRTLQPELDRLLIDETKLTGTYDFQIGKYASEDELFRALRDQLGLVVRPVERKVTVLRVRPHGEFSS